MIAIARMGTIPVFTAVVVGWGGGMYVCPPPPQFRLHVSIGIQAPDAGCAMQVWEQPQAFAKGNIVVRNETPND